jgi:hypothetical protein
VIIGNSAAGLSAAKAIRSKDKKEVWQSLLLKKRSKLFKTSYFIFFGKKDTYLIRYISKNLIFMKDNKIDLLSRHQVGRLTLKINYFI